MNFVALRYSNTDAVAGPCTCDSFLDVITCLNLDQFSSRAREPQFLDDLAHVLRVVAMRDQQRILGIDDHQVFTPTSATNFLGL